MFDTIFVPVDNSDHSRAAVAKAVRLGRAFESRLVGCHVYAARLHDDRFKQMEYTLPERYLEEDELEHQREVHDSLITRGLGMISDSYLDEMARAADAAGLDFERKTMDGKHHVELAADISQSKYDLVLMGAFGLGRARDSSIGSVAERVSRSSDRDVWIVRDLPQEERDASDTILVAIDGSSQSFGGLLTAAELAGALAKKLELVAVYDPYLHYSVFSRIAGVLSAEAAEVFRFEEQNQLHEDIIDSGLAKIYRSHLEVGQTMVEERGQSATLTLLDGKAFQSILDHARDTRPWLLVVGRTGVHGEPSEVGLGSTSENLLRTSPCDILLSAREETPQLDLRAEETVRWTPEAEERMKGVPNQVRGVARTAVLRLAVEKGHTVVTSSIIDEAMDRFMPKKTAQMTRNLVAALVRERSGAAPTQAGAVCLDCGVAASAGDAVRCSVCGGTRLEKATPESLDARAAAEGGRETVTSLDGRTLDWTVAAREALRSVGDKKSRQEVRARTEKAAFGHGVALVTVALVARAIRDVTGEAIADRPPSRASFSGGERRDAEGRRIVATDSGGNALLSRFDWTEDAARRILRVPPGFMRARTQERVEELAEEHRAERIDLGLVRQALEHGRQIMGSMLGGTAAESGDSRHSSRGESGRDEAGETHDTPTRRQRLDADTDRPEEPAGSDPLTPDETDRS